MLKILANDGMDQGAVALLEKKGFDVETTKYEGEALVEKLKEVDVVVIRSATKIRKPLIDQIAGGRLKLIVRAGVGIDNIDHRDAEAANIAVRNTPNASSNAVAELALAHIMTLTRHIHRSNVLMREGKWPKKELKGQEIRGKTLGLIGWGRISKTLAHKAYALGMNVVYYDRYCELIEYQHYCCIPEMEDLLAMSDYVSLHIPFYKEKGATIRKEQFDAMKPGAYLINTARGGVVDEEALLEALDAGHIAGAALDVYEEEPAKDERILNHPKISLTPHIGASTYEAQERIGIETIKVIEAFFKEAK